MRFYHGSNVDGLTVLDPSKGVVDPNEWAGVYEDGQKVEREVVWYTADFELAIAFALKDYVEDLGVDGEKGILYIKSKTPLTPEMTGYVYSISEDIELEMINEFEYISREKQDVTSCTTVNINSFTTYQVEVVEKFPYED